MRHFEHNPRKITDKQLERLKTTLQELGDLSGIVHDIGSDQIIGGNQRVKAMNAEGANPTITERFDPPTAQGTVAIGYLEYGGERFAYRAVKWTSDQCQRANIVANAAGGDWDWSILAESFDPAMLVDAGLDADALAAMNADAAGLGAMLAEEPKEETADVGEIIDRAAELQEKWKVQKGDLWQCGRHRILCGDSTNAEDVARLMGGEKADLLLTDPPYGINIIDVRKGSASVGGAKPPTFGTIRAKGASPFGGVHSARAAIGARNVVDATLYRPVIGDDKPFDPVHLFGMATHSILFGANYYASRLPDSRHWIVWDKNNTGNFADAELAWSDFETGVVMYRHTWNGMQREGERKLEGKNRMHPNQKPVGLMVQILKDHSEENAIVLDCYGGSGSVAVACESSSRQSRTIEIDPAYVAVSLERLSALGLECKRI